MNNKTNNKSIMKKFFFFAAAVVAMAACTKTEVQFNETADSNKIAFTVADYASQTKAPTSLASDEAIYSFHTYATQFPEIGDAVLFMNNEEIKAWDNTPAVVTSGNNIYTWAPEKDYFWPKTGFINFYSYAGTKNPTVNVSDDKKTIDYDYGTITVAGTDNILVADAALHFNSNTQKYKEDHVSKGVPTLFRHQLGKIIFKVHLKTNQPASNNTTWKVRTIENENINSVAYKSSLTVVKNGSLKLTNKDALEDNAEKNTNTQVWAPVVGSSDNVDGWIAADHADATNNEIIPLATQTLTIETTKTESGETSPAYLIAERTIMPQITDNTVFVLYYEVTASHDNFTTAPFLKEIRSVGVDVAKSMKDLVSTIIDWNKNTIVTYNIIIDPVSEKVIFDPAVEEWAAEEGTVNVPLS